MASFGKIILLSFSKDVVSLFVYAFVYLLHKINDQSLVYLGDDMFLLSHFILNASVLVTFVHI